MLLEELLSDEREVGRTEGLVEAVFGLLQELPGQIPETLKEQILFPFQTSTTGEGSLLLATWLQKSSAR